MVAFGQDNATAPKNETSSMAMMNANMSSGGKIPSLSTPGEKALYVFTSEIEGVDEEKLKVAGDAFSVNTLVANKGDKVTVNFYNVDPVKEERHSFTVGDPYAVNIDVGFAESGNATFTADNVGRCISILLQISSTCHARTTRRITINFLFFSAPFFYFLFSFL